MGVIHKDTPSSSAMILQWPSDWKVNEDGRPVFGEHPERIQEHHIRVALGLNHQVPDEMSLHVHRRRYTGNVSEEEDALWRAILLAPICSGVVYISPMLCTAEDVVRDILSLREGGFNRVLLILGMTPISVRHHQEELRSCGADRIFQLGGRIHEAVFEVFRGI